MQEGEKQLSNYKRRMSRKGQRRLNAMTTTPLAIHLPIFRPDSFPTFILHCAFSFIISPVIIRPHISSFTHIFTISRIVRPSYTVTTATNNTFTCSFKSSFVISSLLLLNPLRSPYSHIHNRNNSYA